MASFVNYQRRWTDIYHNLASAYVRDAFRRITLHLCTFRNLSQVYSSLPSWVPNWSQSRILNQGRQFDFISEIKYISATPETWQGYDALRIPGRIVGKAFSVRPVRSIATSRKDSKLAVRRNRQSTAEKCTKGLKPEQTEPVTSNQVKSQQQPVWKTEFCTAAGRGSVPTEWRADADVSG